MTPTLIVVVNEIGREKNLYSKINPQYYKSEEKIIKYPAPGIPDGEHRAYLQWQYNPESISGEWIDESEEDHELSVIYDIETRQKWKLSDEQTIEKKAEIEIVESKPNFLSRLDVYNQTMKESGNRLSKNTVMLMLDRWGNIEYSNGLRDKTPEQQPEGETPKSPDYLVGFADGVKSRDEEVNELKTRISMRQVAYFI